MKTKEPNQQTGQPICKWLLVQEVFPDPSLNSPAFCLFCGIESFMVMTAVTNGPGIKLSKPQLPNLYKGDSQFPCDRIVEMTQTNNCLLNADHSICQNKNLINLWLLLLFFKKFDLFTFIFWLCWVIVAARRLSKFAASMDYFSLQCSGFSLRWLLLWSAGSAAVAHGLSCSTACGIHPEQGLNLCPLHWQMDS